MVRKTKIYIGTSGWHYKHWRGPFYPEEVQSEQYLNYTKHFKTVEINNTFYNLPDKKTIRDWRKAVPDQFIFSVKASRYITHMKKLKDPLGVGAKISRHGEIIQKQTGTDSVSDASQVAGEPREARNLCRVITRHLQIRV